MNILITGVSGLVGGNLAYIYSEKYEVDGVYKDNKVLIPKCDIFSLDISKKESVDKFEKKYDIVIHCAAPTNLDYCEQNKEYADKQIYGATKNMLDYAVKNNSFFVFFSTNAIFDGEKGNYSENDTPRPTNYYGVVKVRAEELVRKYKNHAILRITPYGWNIRNKTSIAEWVLLNLREGKEIKGFVDAIFSPILVNNMAEAIEEIFNRRLTGTYHLGSIDQCSKFDFAITLAKLAELDETLIKPSKTGSFFIAKRGLNLSLNVSKAAKVLSTKLLSVAEGLELFVKIERDGYTKKLKSFAG